MFDEASMVKPTDSHQVKSQATDRILQQVESDAIPPSPDISVSFETKSSVTQGGNHVAEQDADDDENQGHAMGIVQEFIAVGRTQRNSCVLTTNMIVTYAPPLIKEAIPSIYREAEINSELKMWKDTMMEEMSSLYKNDYQSYPRERR